MSMVFCRECGNKIQNTLQTCPNCNAQQQVSFRSGRGIEQESKISKEIIKFIVYNAAYFVAYFMLYTIASYLNKNGGIQSFTLIGLPAWFVLTLVVSWNNSIYLNGRSRHILNFFNWLFFVLLIVLVFYSFDKNGIYDFGFTPSFSLIISVIAIAIDLISSSQGLSEKCDTHREHTDNSGETKNTKDLHTNSYDYYYERQKQSETYRNANEAESGGRKTTDNTNNTQNSESVIDDVFNEQDQFFSGSPSPNLNKSFADDLTSCEQQTQSKVETSDGKSNKLWSHSLAGGICLIFIFNIWFIYHTTTREHETNTQLQASTTVADTVNDSQSPVNTDVAATIATASNNENQVAHVKQVEAPTALPFVGSRYFNFAGGNGTGEQITIEKNGNTVITMCGGAMVDHACSEEYRGPYKNKMFMTVVKLNDLGWMIKGNKIYSIENGKVSKDCGDDGKSLCGVDLETL